MSTYRIEVSSDREANPNSNRQGLWEDAPGDSTGWALDYAKRAARSLCVDSGHASARVVDEETGETIYSF